MTLTKLRRFGLLFITLAVAAFLVVSFACGDDDDDDGGSESTATATESTDDGDNGDDTVTADVEMGDNTFTPDEITVDDGAALTVNLTNVGAAIHNMRIAGADKEYDTDDDAVSDPELISGGDTGTVEWTAPDAAGDVPFRCDFHPTDMVGVIVVE